jgi:hypothetical protein
MRPEVLLTVTASNGAAAVVDLYENESISYSSNFNSVSEFTTRGAFSREFRIPATKNNVDFFGQQYDVNLLNNDTTQINVLRKIDATISVNTLPIAEGHIQFKQALTHQGQLHEFVIAFFGETVDLARSIGDKMLSELDYSSLAHENTYENVNLINEESLFDGDICYTLTDKGQNWSEDSTLGSRRVLSNANPVYTSELTLAVKAKWILDKIISEAGFSWNGDTIVDELDKMYIPYVTTPLTLGSLTNDEAKFNSNYATDQTFTLTQVPLASYYKAQLTGWTETLDPSNSFASDVYTAQGNFDITFNAKVFIEGIVPFVNLQTFSIYIGLTRNGVETLQYMNGGIGTNQSLVYSPTGGPFGTGGYIQQYISTVTVGLCNSTLSLLIGDEVRLYIYGHQGSDTSIKVTEGSLFYTSNVTGELQGQAVNFVRNTPEMKQVDFLKDIIKIFNGVFVANPNLPKAVDLIPMAEYLGSGNDYDWTDKLDTSKDIILTPASDIRKRLLKWSYKDQGDYFNAKYKTGAQRIYGELRLNDPGNDFSTNDFTVELVFGASPCDLIPNTTFVIPKYFNSNGEFMTPGPRILYRRRTIEDAQIMVYDDVAENGVLTAIPLLSHYSEIPTDIGTNDLNFGQEIPPHPIEVMPLHTLFDRYWREYIAELYDDEQKIMEAYFQLDVTDVFNLKFNDKIWIKDSFWRVIELTDYIIADEQVTKCKLMRLLNIGALCQFKPSSINSSNGAVTFINYDGEESAGSQECCEFYGYKWNTSLGRCFATPAGNGTKGVISSPNSIGKSNITNESGNQKSSTGMGNTNRSTIENNNEFILVSGLGHAIAPNNNYSQALGYSNFIRTNLEGTSVMGRWAQADVRGVHFGGGNWYDNTSDFGTALPGRSQHGFIQLMGLGELTSNPIDIDLLLDGIDGGTIDMPTETVWMVKVYISIMEYFYGSGDFTSKVASLEYSSMLWRDKVNHHSSTPVLVNQFNAGWGSGLFTLSMPVVSNQIAPYITANVTGKTAVISATLQYTQSKFQRIPLL